MVFPRAYPRFSGEFHGKDLPDHRGTKGNESRFVRCKICNTINDTEIRKKGVGWASSNIDYQDSGATDTTLKYPVVSGGCWFCGSSEGW